jgi:hypothetical protein
MSTEVLKDTSVVFYLLKAWQTADGMFVNKLLYVYVNSSFYVSVEGVHINSML